MTIKWGRLTATALAVVGLVAVSYITGRCSAPTRGLPHDEGQPTRVIRATITRAEEVKFGLRPQEKRGTIGRAIEKVTHVERGPEVVAEYPAVDPAPAPYGIQSLEYCRTHWTAFVLDHASGLPTRQQGSLSARGGCAEYRVDQGTGLVSTRERRNLLTVDPFLSGHVGTNGWFAGISPVQLHPGSQFEIAPAVGAQDGSLAVDVSVRGYLF